MAVKVEFVSPTSEHLPALCQIYAAAFKPLPYNKTAGESQSFSIGFERMTQREDFRMVLALHDDRPIGFAYGYHLKPEYGWHAVLGPPLEQAELGHWLEDAFCLAEMALRPGFWGKGIGGNLHDKLLSDLPYKHQLLSTMQDDSTNGYKLYLKRGWHNLLEDIWVSEVERAYRVMGR